MTLAVHDYFRTRRNDRKKEPRYLNVIDTDSCTSCEACASVCPVDCIYEVRGKGPSQSYHQIDTSRCIGCQLCYRSPRESSAVFTLTLCPWNAIDILHNPTRQRACESILQPYWLGRNDDLPWPKLEEYGYRLFLDGEVFLPADARDLIQSLDFLQQEQWRDARNAKCTIVKLAGSNAHYLRYTVTEEGRAILSVVFEDYEGLFLD